MDTTVDYFTPLALRMRGNNNVVTVYQVFVKRKHKIDLSPNDNKEAGIMSKRTITKTPSYSLSPKDLYNSLCSCPFSQPVYYCCIPKSNTEKVVSHSVQTMPLEEQLRDQCQTSTTEPLSHKHLPLTDRTNKHFSQDHVDAQDYDFPWELPLDLSFTSKLPAPLTELYSNRSDCGGNDFTKIAEETFLSISISDEARL